MQAVCHVLHNLPACAPLLEPFGQGTQLGQFLYYVNASCSSGFKRCLLLPPKAP